MWEQGSVPVLLGLWKAPTGCGVESGCRWQCPAVTWWRQKRSAQDVSLRGATSACVIAKGDGPRPGWTLPPLGSVVAPWAFPEPHGKADSKKSGGLGPLPAGPQNGSLSPELSGHLGGLGSLPAVPPMASRSSFSPTCPGVCSAHCPGRRLRRSVHFCVNQFAQQMLSKGPGDKKAPQPDPPQPVVRTGLWPSGTNLTLGVGFLVSWGRRWRADPVLGVCSGLEGTAVSELSAGLLRARLLSYPTCEVRLGHLSPDGSRWNGEPSPQVLMIAGTWWTRTEAMASWASRLGSVRNSVTE